MSLLLANVTSVQGEQQSRRAGMQEKGKQIQTKCEFHPQANVTVTDGGVWPSYFLVTD